MMDYQKILESHSLGGELLLTKDSEKILYSSSSLCGLLGFKEEEILSKNHYDLFDSVNIEKFKANIIKQLEENKNYAITYHVKCKESSSINVEETGCLVEFEGKEYITARIFKRIATSSSVHLSQDYDSLTNLYSRYYIENYIDELTKRKDIKSTILFIDVDNFKQVNDNFGHRMGDEVLIKIGKTFQKSIEGMSARVSRYGGDEFVFVFENTKTRKEIEKYICALQKQFLDELCQYVRLANISLSIGAVYNFNGESKERILEMADIAANNAKAKGKNTYVFYRDTFDIVGQENTRGIDMSMYYTLMGKMSESLLSIFSKEETNDVLYDAIKFLGESIGIDTIMILEKSLDGRFVRLNSQWAKREELLTPIKNMQMLPIERLFTPTYINGIAFIPDLNDCEQTVHIQKLASRGVKTILNVEIYQGMEVIGYIFYDIYENGIVLEASEVQALVAGASLIGEHIRRRRNVEKAMERQKSMKRVLDTFEKPVLVIDKETLVLKFVNKKCNEMNPKLQEDITLMDAMGRSEQELQDILSSALSEGNIDGYTIEIAEWELDKKAYLIY